MSSVTWQSCFQQMLAEHPEEAINTYLGPLEAEEDSGILRLFAPNQVLLQQVRRQYLDQIERVVATLDESLRSVHLVIGSSSSESANTSPQTAGSANVPAQAAKMPSIPSVIDPSDHLLPKFSFDTFVVGRSNEMAYAVAEAVANGAGHPNEFNPLLICGGVGLGKTHLLQAIGNAIRNTHPQMNVAYLHSEQYVQSLVSSLQHKCVDKFKNFYRSLDILLIDDIQFLAGKEHSQQEFFHTFNSLAGKQRQIILTCDRYPKEVKGMEDRLQSRLGGGLFTTIEPPNTEHRAAILRSKAESRGIELSQDVVLFIAENLSGSVRELEAALNKVVFKSRLKQVSIDIDFVHETLHKEVAVRDRLIDVEQIKDTIADYFKMPKEELSSRRRLQGIIRPRHLAMKLCHELTSMSYASIGEAFGRDHSTVIHACQKIKKDLEDREPKTLRAYTDLRRKLLN